MRSLATLVLCLLLPCAMLGSTGCRRTTPPPPMPQVANPVPGPTADPLEVERYQLIEEKQTLEAQYGDNLARIQAINARLIQINIELQQHGRRW